MSYPRFHLEPLPPRILLSTTQVPITLDFQHGASGYSGTHDTYVRLDQPTSTFGGSVLALVDNDDNALEGNQPVQALIRFDQLFGAAAGQIPIGATITSATLTIATGTGTGDGSPDTISLHRMLTTWDESSTWDSLVDGVTPGTDATAGADTSYVPALAGESSAIDVTASLQAWAGNPSQNFGWALISNGANAYRWRTSEDPTLSARPILSVTYQAANAAPIVSAGSDKVITLPGAATLIGSAYDDGQPTSPGALGLLWEMVSGPGTVTFGSPTASTTSASFSIDGTYVLRLTASDGELSSSDDVIVVVRPANPPVSVTVREGVDAYAGTQDTYLRQDSANTSFGSSDVVLASKDDNSNKGNQGVQALLRFDGLFGEALGQIPVGSTINSATLTLTTTDATRNRIAVHRMLRSWSETSTWNSLSGGISTNDTEAASSAEATLTPVATGAVSFSVRTSVQAWANNPTANFGWAFLSNNNDLYRFASSEHATLSMRPTLTINYTKPLPAQNLPPQVSAGPDRSVTLPNAASLDGTVSDDGLPAPSTLTHLWEKVIGPGDVAFGNPNAVDTTATFSAIGTYVLRLTTTDGNLTGMDEMTVTVTEPTSTTDPSLQPLTPVQLSDSTGEKPQSKLWKHDNTWWSVFPTATGTFVWRLDGTSWTQVFQINTRSAGEADVLVAGNLAHVLLYDGSGGTRLASLEYVPGVLGAPGAYQFWSQRTNDTIVPLSSGVETATIALDGAGRLWLASDAGTSVEVRYSDGNYSTWSAPITLASGLTTDDICVIGTLPDGSVALMWSNQTTQRFGFRTHAAGADPTLWSADEVPASSSALNVGLGFADDHMNFAIGSDGTVYAAVKTSYDTNGFPVIGLLVRRPNGTWDSFYTVDTDLTATRGIVVVNEQQGVLIVAYRVQLTVGTGTIVYRVAPLSNPGAFGPRQTMISGDVNNVTSTRQIISDDAVFAAGDGVHLMSSVRFVWPSSGSSTLLASGSSSTLFADATTIGTADDDDLESLAIG